MPTERFEFPGHGGRPGGRADGRPRPRRDRDHRRGPGLDQIFRGPPFTANPSGLIQVAGVVTFGKL